MCLALSLMDDLASKNNQKYRILAPQDGIEPPTKWLTVTCSTAELLGNKTTYWYTLVNAQSLTRILRVQLLAPTYLLRFFARNAHQEIV